MTEDQFRRYEILQVAQIAVMNSILRELQTISQDGRSGVDWNAAVEVLNQALHIQPERASEVEKAKDV